MSIPTILIGLGGTGSKIVNLIAAKYSTLDQRTQARIPSVFMAFDTDINDIDRIKNLEPHNIFQISTNLTVGGYVDNHGREIENWFPVNEQDLHSKSMLDGAGQIRIFSRLAFDAKMRDPIFQQNIHNCINVAAQLAHGQLNNMRIYLVGSFSGGTGSGIFPSLSVWLAKEFSIYNPVIKGILFMPDIYVSAYNLPADQHENLRTNGFAAIKELEAILRIQAGLAPSELVFDYNPRSEVKSIPHNDPIITLLYLIDYETSRGNIIAQDHTEYENMVVQGIFNQLFTPIGATQRSIEDNNILARVVNSRQNSLVSNYCTFGVAAYEYPYEDILLYLAKRFSVYGIGSKWLALDEEYRKVKADYLANLNAGMVHLEEPRIEEVYVRKLQSLAELDRDQYFYKIYQQVRLSRSTSEGEVEQIDQVKEFIDHATDYLERNIENDVYFNTRIKEMPILRPEELKNYPVKNGEIERQDMILRDANTNRDHTVFTVTDMVFRIIAYQGEEKLDSDLPRHSIQYYIRKDQPHPIAVRFFLYDLMLRLEQEKKVLQSEVHKLRDSLDKYFDPLARPDLKTHENIEESYSERMAYLESMGWVKRKFSKEMGTYLEWYCQRAATEKKNLGNYIKSYSRLRLHERLYDFVKKLVDEYVLFFNSIPGMLDAIKREADELEVYHDNKQQTSFVHYILASAKAKQAVWEQYVGSLAMDTSSEISGQLNQLVYMSFVQSRGKVITLTDEPLITNYKDEFARLIIPFNVQTVRRQLAAELNFNAATALFKEAEWELPQAMRGGDTAAAKRKEKITAVFDDLRHRADGFLLFVNRETINHMLLFGMHNEVEKNLKSAMPGFNGLLKRDPGDQGVTDGFFSPYIIQACRIQYNINITNVTKFAFPEGRYYASYRKRVRKLSEAIHWHDEVQFPSYFSDDQFKTKVIPPHIVPHIDRNWHKSFFIGELDHREQEQYHHDLKSAILHALLYNYIEIGCNEREVTLTRNLPDCPRVTKNIARTLTPLLHLNAFVEQNPGLISTILSTATHKFGKEYSRYTHDIEKYTINERLNEVKDLLAGEILTLRGKLVQQKLVFSWIGQLIYIYQDFVNRVLDGTPEEKEKYFKSRVNYFQHRRGAVAAFSRDEMKELKHICSHFTE